MFHKRFVILIILYLTISKVIECLQPVEIIAIHNSTVLLVKNFPKSKALKLLWWENNRNDLLNKYGVGALDRYGDFRLVVHDFGAGYKVDTHTDQDSDLLCFYEMKEQANCLVKDALFAVNNYNPKKLNFTYY
ncbi:DUF943 family protein [Rouxiella sp. T17]|uniref:DUF943 family protein n=1 Tax=Rouxiella sp. T17 TaxID=3085684 RepID=UPI002FC6B7B1